jgi:hypothetical protein
LLDRPGTAYNGGALELRINMLGAKSIMRALALFLALLGAAPAMAQGWKEYSYPDYSFDVAFPVEPKIETTTFQAADGRQVQARVYSATRDRGVFTLTIADIPGRAAQKDAEIDHAAKALIAGDTVKLDIPHRISRVYGRQLSIARADGSYSSVALFYYKQRLFQIEGKVAPGGDNSTADAIRFQQSLVFTAADD